MSGLNIISTENKQPLQNKVSAMRQRRIERTAYFEKLWRDNPERFDKLHTSIGRERFERLKMLLQPNIKPDQVACDLACGAGATSLWLCQQGLHVDAVDIASNALQILRKKYPSSSLTTIHDYVPYTTLKDDSYDLLICTDLIAELHPNEYRILFSELARLVKQNGKIICSTPLDFHSEDALQRFIDLAETELEIVEINYAYDKLFIKFSDFLAWPRRVERACRDPQYRKEALKQRQGFSKWMFQLFSHSPFRYLWKAISFLTDPLSKFYDNSDRIRSFFEKITHFLSQENGITHVIILAIRRAIPNTDPKTVPHDVQERKGKKTVWE